MTSSSSPGISLKQEGISYLAADELPAVIVNMVRGGPAWATSRRPSPTTSRPPAAAATATTRPSCWPPARCRSSPTVVPLAFDLADKYRNPVIILGDGMLGQMMEPVDFDEPRAAARLPEGLRARRGPRTGRPASIHSLIFDTKLQEEHNWKLLRKFQLMEQNEVRYETYLTDDAEMVVVAYGMGARIAKGAIKRLRQEGLKVGLLRPITLWPFPAQGAPGDGQDGERLLRLRDERRPDGRGREAGAGRAKGTCTSTAGPGA